MQEYKLYIIGAGVVGFVVFIIYINIKYRKMISGMTKEEREELKRDLHEPGDW